MYRSKTSHDNQNVMMISVPNNYIQRKNCKNKKLIKKKSVVLYIPNAIHHNLVIINPVFLTYIPFQCEFGVGSMIIISEKCKFMVCHSIDRLTIKICVRPLLI